jgi:hypothetical protein
VLAATDSPTVPLALPLFPETIASQSALDDADHAQPFSVDTPTDNGPPAAAIESRARLSAKVQGAPAWLSGARSAPTIRAPDRGEGTGLTATEKGTTALPWPSRAPVIDTHAASAATDHVQSRAAEIVAEPEPPLAVKDEGALAIDTAHLSADGATTDEDVVEEVQPARTIAPSARVGAQRSKEQPIRLSRTSPNARASPSGGGRTAGRRARLAEKVFRLCVLFPRALRYPAEARATARSICAICRATCPAAKSASSYSDNVPNGSVTV